MHLTTDTQVQAADVRPPALPGTHAPPLGVASAARSATGRRQPMKRLYLINSSLVLGW
jgi:hypothetical protein